MKKVLADDSNPYSSDASFNVPKDYDFCYRERGIGPRIEGTTGVRRTTGGGGGGGTGGEQQNSNETHQAETMQGVFD